MNSVTREFERRVEHHQFLYQQLNKKVDLFSWIRAIVFLVSLSFSVYLLSVHEIVVALIVFSLGFIFFGTLVNWHNRLKFRRGLQFEHIDLNKKEIALLERDFQGLDQGHGYLDKNHPYSSDLDVFGHRSLFQLLNRSRLRLTKDKLAEWLSTPADVKEILLRQEAVKELTTKDEWRQRFLALGGVLFKGKEGGKQDDLLPILNLEVSTQSLAFIKLAKNIVTPLAIGLLIYLSFHPENWSVLLVFFVVNYILSGRYGIKSIDATLIGGQIFSTIKTYSMLLEHIEQGNFQSTILSKLHVRLKEEQLSSKSIRKLGRIVHLMESRSNMFYAVLNGLFLIDFHILYRYFNWKKTYSHLVESWVDTVSTFDVVAGMSSYASGNPTFVFPQIFASGHQYEAQGLGHPLLNQKMLKTNDFTLEGKGSVVLLTGSNMSGKSTFLRTLGLNAVLAYAGAPVAASSMSLSRFNVFTSMRNQDNLDENISSFYAELKRLNQLLKTLKTQEFPTFYLLDELLKGTNSSDRHTGCEALIRQLVCENAYGLISTHDLALTSLDQEVSQLRNFSFNSDVKGDKIYFDYKLSEGACRSFNASYLMKKMGIGI